MEGITEGADEAVTDGTSLSIMLGGAVVVEGPGEEIRDGELLTASLGDADVAVILGVK